MGNFYAPDVIRTPQGELKIIDMHGTSGGGLTVIQHAYGNIDDVKKFVSTLNGMAEGGKIVYCGRFSYQCLSTFPRENSFTDRFGLYDPITDWVGDAINSDRRTMADREMRPEFRKPYRIEQHFLHRAAQELRSEGEKIDMIFCEEMKRKGDDKFILRAARPNLNRKPKDIDVGADEIGVYYHWGGSPNFDFVDAKFNVVNDPRIESIFCNKMVLRHFLEKTGYKDIFPEYMYVGMGTASKGSLRKFVSAPANGNTPDYVIKPILGALGLGVRFLTKEEISNRFMLSDAETGHDLSELAEAMDVDEVSLTIEQGLYNEDFELSDLSSGYSIFLNSETEKFINDGADSDSKLEMTEVDMKRELLSLKFHNFKVMDHYVAVLERFVDSEPVEIGGKWSAPEGTRKYKGYIRPLFLDGNLITALYRHPIAPYEGKFIDMTAHGTRTDFAKVDDEMKEELQRRLMPMFLNLEKAVTDEVKTKADLDRIRDEEILKNIKKAHEEIVG